MFLDHCENVADYWEHVDLRSKPASESEVRYRMRGMLFSLLVMFDGGSANLPAFDIVPSPHPDDAEYLKGEGENWWTATPINADVQLHDVLSARERARRSK